jgi:hypothetical protein
MRRDEINDRLLMPHGPICLDVEANALRRQGFASDAPRTEKEFH